MVGWRAGFAELRSMKLIFLALFCSTASAQTSARLDSLFSARFPANAPGVAVLVAQKGSILYEKAFGSASLELQTPLAPDMLFDIGSITKQFTAVAVLQLVEQGRIRLSDSIQRYIPAFPHVVKIENLLTHTSGIPDYMRLHPADPYLERKDFTPAEIIDTLATRPLEFKPGTRFEYSNSGYFLLGYIIQRVTGEPYHTYLEDHLFKPLGLHHTFYNLPGEVIPGHVYGYKNETGRFEKADYWSATLPFAAGGLVSNVGDLLAWQNGLHKLLKPATLQKAWTSFVLPDGVPTGYGYGWYVTGAGPDRMISHGGAITGFRTSVLYYPAQDVFVAVLANCECTSPDELAESASDIVLGRSSLRLPDSLMERYTGTYKMGRQTLVIRRAGDHLVADLGGQGVYQIHFSSPVDFTLIGVLDASGTFTTDGFTIHQHGVYYWKKTTP